MYSSFKWESRGLNPKVLIFMIASSLSPSRQFFYYNVANMKVLKCSIRKLMQLLENIVSLFYEKNSNLISYFLFF